MTRVGRWLAAFGAALACVATARADERILDFHSDIAVVADGSMQVDETIRVRAEGERIRHGIYRDFPTDYRDAYNNRVHVDFKPFALTRDGAPEPFHTEGLANGVRVYFGSKDVTLPAGEHAYVLSYKTTRQLGFFADHDELYWNVTGNGWDFAIDMASAAVTLPDAIAPERLHVEGYTGPQGAKGADYRARIDAPSHAVFATTRPLAPRQGLTIVVAFPKGVVAPPGASQHARWFLHDNAAVLIGLIGLALTWLYYLPQWGRVGRDPRAGVIIPQYEAPEGFSPGGLRHIERMKYDDRCFAADVVDLAVRGALRISQDRHTFALHRTGAVGNDVPPAEAALFAGTLGDQEDLILRQSEHETIGAARKQHKALLEQAGPRYFHRNSLLVIPGALIGLLALLLAAFAGGLNGNAAFMLIWLSGWSVGVVLLVAIAIAAWRQPPGARTYAAAIGATLFAVPFLIGEIAGIGFLVYSAGLGFALVVAALIVTNVAFYQWLKAPTVEGRKLLDRIAGLRLYLGVAERDELKRQAAPQMTLDEFQKFLPYALALGVEKTWADRFAAAVGPAAAAAAAATLAWYQGSSGSLGNLSNLAGGLGSSLSGAIASSSTAPGSSSGSGGGGSSGGGGGGGGGGGW